MENNIDNLILNAQNNANQETTQQSGFQHQQVQQQGQQQQQQVHPQTNGSVVIDQAPQGQQVQGQQQQQAPSGYVGQQPQNGYQQPQQGMQQPQNGYQQQPQQGTQQPQNGYQQQPQQGMQQPQNGYQQQPQQGMQQPQNGYQQQPQQGMQQYQQAPQQQAQHQLPAHLAQMTQPMEMTMDALDGMGMSVDHWLKPDFNGMTVGEIPSVIPYVDVEIEMTQNHGFVLGMGLRFGKDPVQYDFTHDNVVSSKNGMPWSSVLQNAVMIDAGALPYRAAQLCFDILSDVTGHDGTLVAKAGESLGYTTPQSNWTEWSNFYKACVKHGLIGTKVKARITNKSLDKNKNKWGVAVITLLDEVTTTQATAA